MREIILAATALLGFSSAAIALDPGADPETNLDRHGHYRNVDGLSVHAPAKTVNGLVPTDASAKCRDGTYSFSKHHAGTCSGHQGVAEWIKE